MADIKASFTQNIDATVNIDGALKQELEATKARAEQLDANLKRARHTVEQLSNELNNLKTTRGIIELENQLDEFRNTASRSLDEFKDFLKTVQLQEFANVGEGFYRFREWFNNISEGAQTASEAIAEVKAEYSELIMSGSGNSSGTIDSQMLRTFTSTLQSVASSIDEVRAKLTEFQENGIRAIPTIQGSDNTISGLEQVKNTIKEMADSANGAYEPLTKLIGVMTDYANIDNTNLFSVSQAIAGLGEIGKGSYSVKSVENTINLLTRLQTLTRAGAIHFNVTGLEAFSNLSVRKASLNNLATFLPTIASVDVANLERLSHVDLSNFNNLDIKKASMNNLVQMIDAVNNMRVDTGWSNDLIQLTRSISGSVPQATKSISALTDNVQSLQNNLTKTSNQKLSIDTDSIKQAGEDSAKNIITNFGQAYDYITNRLKSPWAASVLMDFKTVLEQNIELANEFYSALSRAVTVGAVHQLIIAFDDLRREELDVVNAANRFKAIIADQFKTDIPSVESFKRFHEYTSDSIKSLTTLRQSLASVIGVPNDDDKALSVTLQQLQSVVDKATMAQKYIDRIVSSFKIPYREVSSDLGNIEGAERSLQTQTERCDMSKLNGEMSEMGEVAQRVAIYLGRYRDALNDAANTKVHNSLTDLGIAAKDADVISQHLSDMHIKVKSITPEWETITKIIDEEIIKEQKLKQITVQGTTALGDAVNHVIKFNAETGDISKEITRATVKGKELKQTIKELADGTKETNIETTVANLKEIDGLIKSIEKTNSSLNSSKNKVTDLLGGLSTTGKNREELDAINKKFDELTVATERLKTNRMTANQEDVDGLRKVQEELDALIRKSQERLRIESEANKKPKETKAVDFTVDGQKAEATLETIRRKLADLKEPSEEAKKSVSDLETAITAFNTATTQEDKQRALTNINKLITIANTRLSEQKIIQNKLEQANKRAETAERQAATSKEQALKRALALLKQIEQAESNWTAARKGKSKEEYSYLSTYATSLRQYMSDLESGKLTVKDFVAKMNQLSVSFQGTGSVIRANGEDVKSFGERVRELGSKFSAWFGVTRIIMRIYSTLRQMVSASIEVDNAMTQLQIVTKESDQVMSKFGDTAADAAKRIGSSVTDFLSSATTFARLGYSLNESSQLAEYTAMLQNVGNIDVAQAQDAITSIVKAYSDIDINQIESVMDKLVSTGNGFPISVGQIAEGMTNASAALSAAGNSFDQSVALLTAANAATQNAAKASTGLRTIAARIRKTKTELDDLGETMETADYDKIVQQLTHFNVSLTDVNGEYRSTYDIMADIAAKWNDMTSMEQAALAEALSGNRQQQIFYSIINNFKEASGAMDAMSSSAGTLKNAYSTYMESTTAHINQFKASFQDLSSNLFKSDLLKFFIDLGTRIVNAMNGLQKVHILLPTIVAIATAIRGIGLAKRLAESTAKINVLTAATIKEKTVTESLKNSVAALTIKERERFAADIQNAAASGKLSDEEAKQILTTLGLATADGTLTVANKSLAGSFKTLMASIPVWGWIALGVSVLADVIIWLSSSVSSTSDNIRSLEESFAQTQNEMRQISDEFKNLKESADETIPRFSDLAKGVDDFGKNISLTDEEYKEFLSLNNKIAEMFPQLNMGMDENGNYMLALSYSADTLRESLEQLLEVQRQEANEALAKKMPQNINDVLGVAKEYSNQIKDIKSDIEVIQSGVFVKSVDTGDLNVLSNIQAKAEYDDFVEYLRKKGIEVEEIIDSTPGGTVYTAKWDKTSDASTNLVIGSLKKIDDLESRITSKWKTINPSINAWLQSDYLYNDMNSQMQQVAQTMANALDFNALGLVTDNGEDTADNIQTYITKYIINPLYSSSDEVKTAFKDSISLFESGEISETEFADRMKVGFDKLKQGMDDGEVTEFTNAFIKGFNAMGMAGDDFDSVVDSLVKSWGKFGDSTPADSKSLIELSKATEKLKSNYEIIQKAQKEMYGTTDENAGISADTIKSLASATDDYLDYLYEENGVLKLNVEKWEEYSSQGMRDSIEHIENEIKQLEDRNDNISEGIELAKMYQDEVNMAKELGVTANDTIFGNIDTNNRQVLEWNKESLQKFKNAYESWGWAAEELEGSISTVLGNHDNFDGIDIAFTPMLQTKDGAVLLDYNTVHEYIWGLIDKAGEGWTNEDVLKLDTEGLEFDGVLIKNLIAGIGDEAEKASRQMHFTGTDGSLNLGISELSSYAKEFYNITVVADDYSGKLSKTQMRVSDFCKYINGLSSKIDENSDSIKSNQDLLKLYKGVLNSIVNDDEFNATIVCLKKIQESLKNVSGAISTLIGLKEEINKNGGLSLSSVEKIMSDDSLTLLRPYINDVKTMLPIITGLIDDQKQAYEDLYNEQQRLADPDAYIEASQQKQEEDENAFQNSVKKINEQVAKFKEKYDVDLSNWEKLGDGKKELLKNTNAELLSKQLNLINDFAKYYNTDLTNFKNVAEAKIAILDKFRTTDIFNQAINMLDEFGTSRYNKYTMAARLAADKTAQAKVDKLFAESGSPLTWQDFREFLLNEDFTPKGSELLKKQLEEIVNAYTITPTTWDDMTKNIGASGGSSGSSSKEKTWFEKQYAYHNHLVNMEQETEKSYLDWLDGAYKEAYRQGIIDLDAYYKYEEEVYKGRKKLTGDSVSWFEQQYKQHQHYLKMEQEDDADYLKWLNSAYQQAYKEGLLTLDEYRKYREEVYEGVKRLRDEAESAVKSLIDIRIDMLKEDVNKEKEAIDKKLKNLKDFYDKQKEMLQDKYDEEKYLDEQAEKRKKVSDVQAQIEALRMDDSAKAQKRRVELTKDLQEAQKDLTDFEKEHTFNETKDQLDKLYENQEKVLNKQTEALDKKLSSPQELYEQALNDIRNGSQNLYGQMIEWNNLYGDGIRDTIKKAWEEAYKAEKQYFNYTGTHFNGVNLGNATGYVKGVSGYASGTSHSLAGIHKVDEQGIETIFQSADGQRYRMFSSGEKVLNASASDFLYKFANKGREILDRLFNGASHSYNNVVPGVVANNIQLGDIVIQGNADKSTVSEIRRAQRENLEQMLKQLNRLK